MGSVLGTSTTAGIDWFRLTQLDIKTRNSINSRFRKFLILCGLYGGAFRVALVMYEVYVIAIVFTINTHALPASHAIIETKFYKLFCVDSVKRAPPEDCDGIFYATRQRSCRKVMFSQVCVCVCVCVHGGPNVTITHDALELTVRGPPTNGTSWDPSP